MKIQFISDLEDNLVAVQLPIEEYLRLKKAAGEPAEGTKQTETEPKTDKALDGTKESDASKAKTRTTQPSIRASASVADILGRNPKEKYKYYTHEVEGSWLGNPKKGQRTAGPSEDIGGKRKNHNLPRTGSRGDKKRYWTEGKGKRARKK